MTPIRMTYVAQGLSVAVMATAMYLGWQAYLRDREWIVVWNALVFAINAALFLFQGRMRQKWRRILK